MVKNSRSSSGLFNIQLSGAIIPETLKSFLFDPETSKEMNMEIDGDHDHDHGHGHDQDEIEVHEGKKRGNWIEMIMELRNKWQGNQHDDELVESDSGEGCDGEGGCDVEYDEDDGDDGNGNNEVGREVSIDRERFSSMLDHVSWSDTKLFAQLAFLCNMAYVIPDIKVCRYCLQQTVHLLWWIGYQRIKV